VEEHYGRRAMARPWTGFSPAAMLGAANKVRTAPLWGVRTHSRLMHDGQSLTLTDAIVRHKGEAEQATEAFKHLTPEQQEAILTFLKSL